MHRDRRRLQRTRWENHEGCSLGAGPRAERKKSKVPVIRGRNDMRFLRVTCMVSLIGTLFIAGCSRDVGAVTPQQIENEYGIAGAHAGTAVAGADGSVRGSVVPVTLKDGRKAEPVIPARMQSEACA